MATLHNDTAIYVLTVTHELLRADMEILAEMIQELDESFDLSTYRSPVMTPEHIKAQLWALNRFRESLEVIFDASNSITSQKIDSTIEGLRKISSLID